MQFLPLDCLAKAQAIGTFFSQTPVALRPRLRGGVFDLGLKLVCMG